MKLSNFLDNKVQLRTIQILIIAASVLWCFSFNGFLLGTSEMKSDASAYGEHIRYFADNISRGVYPMWEPTRNYGVPIELFLRRIGSYNPLFFILAGVHRAGIPYIASYVFFLSLYYLLAMIGFYCIAKRLYKDTNLAFLAYLLLLFSSLGTRIFDSYIIFMFVPMVWFFYFLISFSQEPRKHSFLGLTFCLMNIATTYIPFYFLIIFLSFIICIFIIYFRDIKPLFLKYLEFIKNNTFFVVLCFMMLAASLSPGILFFLDTSRAELVLPYRNYNWSHTEAPAAHALAVDIYNITKWGITEDILFSSSFTNLKDMNFAVLYLPVFAYIIFFLSLATYMTKRLVVLFCWGVVLFLMVSPHFPIYQYLYDHVFFMKLFRNLHFFLWVALLPIFILILVEQFKNCLERPINTQRSVLVNLGLTILIHFGFLLYFLQNEGTLYSSYSVVILSLLFFIFHFLGWLKLRGTLFAVSMLVLVSLQPLEVYHHFNKNVLSQRYLAEGKRYNQLRYNDLSPYLDLTLPKGQERKSYVSEKEFTNQDGDINVLDIKRSTMYMAQKWIIYLSRNMNLRLLYQYSRHPLILYDNVQWVEDEDLNVNRVGVALLKNENLAFIAPEKHYTDNDLSFIKSLGNQPKVSGPALSVTRDNMDVTVLRYNVNTLTLKTNLKDGKFLIYNDSFHSKWKAKINGEPLTIFRANVGFKGVWIPAGEHSVTFRFGRWWEYVLNLGLLGLFALTFMSLIVLCVQHHQAKADKYEGI